MNGLLSNTFHKFSLIDRICHCLSITLPILGNGLLKVSTNSKFPWVDCFFLFFNLYSWLFQTDGPEF